MKALKDFILQLLKTVVIVAIFASLCFGFAVWMNKLSDKGENKLLDENSFPKGYEEDFKLGASGGRSNEEIIATHLAQNAGKVPSFNNIGSEFTLISENDNYELYAILDNADKRMGEIALKDKKANYVWFSNPQDAESDHIAYSKGQAYCKNKSQIIIEYAKGLLEFQESNSFYESVYHDLVTASVEDGRVKFTYRFRKLGFVIPVAYYLDDDGFKAEILLDDPEARFSYMIHTTQAAWGTVGTSIEVDQEVNVTEIKLLPAFGASGMAEDGYMFVPDGSGAIINFNNGKTTVTQPYSQPVTAKYIDVEDETYTKNATDRYLLPVYGSVKSTGHAFMAVIEENAAVATIEAEVSGYETGYNKVSSTFIYKIVKGASSAGKAQPASSELREEGKNYVVKFFTLNGDDASYVGMAKRYRQYLIEEKGMLKSNDLKDGALILDLYAGTPLKTSIAGIPWTVFRNMTDYADIKEIADDLDAAGIDDVAIRFNDFQKMGQREKVQSRLTFEGEIGGKKGFMDANSYLADKGYSFYPNIDFMNFVSSGRGFSRLDDAAKLGDQSPLYIEENYNSHINLGNRWNILSAGKVAEAASTYKEDMKKVGIGSISMENMGNVVYSNADSSGHSRGDAYSIFTGIMAGYKEDGMNIMTEHSAEHALLYSDIVLGVPTKETYIELADEAVPFYQLVVRGLKTYSLEPVNLASNPNDVMLNALETGASVTYTLVKGETVELKETKLRYLFSCDYDSWKDEMLSLYSTYKKGMDEIKGKDIVNHEKVADGVYKTTYEGNVAIYVNYNEFDVTLAGVEVPAKSYAVKRG